MPRLVFDYDEYDDYERYNNPRHQDFIDDMMEIARGHGYLVQRIEVLREEDAGRDPDRWLAIDNDTG